MRIDIDNNSIMALRNIERKMLGTIDLANKLDFAVVQQ